MRAVKPTKERASRKKQRQRLIDATISALHQYGPSRTTVDKVVSIAHMSPGIVTFYFDSKAAMLVAALEYLADEFEEEVMGPVGQLRHDPVKALELLVSLYIDSDVATARKVSVWYAFWGEASARQEYSEICGRKDDAFGDIVRELIAALVAEDGQTQLNSDAIALGLIGALEMMWQAIAFLEESQIDRKAIKERCMAYLRSIFPSRFGSATGAAARLRVIDGGQKAHALRPAPVAPRNDAERFAEERDRLFLEGWQFVGHQAQIQRKGDFLTAEIAGERVLVVRDRAGLRGFHNVCRHRPHAVATAPHGRFLGQIECPSDGWSYALDGALTGPAEALARQGSDPASLGLSPVEIETIGGLIFARMAGGAGSDLSALKTLLADTGLDHLDEIGTPIEREIAADWKTVSDHLLDSYFAGDIDRAAPWLGVPAIDKAGPDGAVRWLASIKRTTNGLGWTASRLVTLLDMLDPALLRRERAWQRIFIFPNLMIELFPEAAAIWRIVPVAPGRTRLTRTLFGTPSASRELRALTYLNIRQALRRIEADAATAESTEAGLNSRVSPQPAWRDEDGPAGRFQAWLGDTLGE